MGGALSLNLNQNPIPPATVQVLVVAVGIIAFAAVNSADTLLALPRKDQANLAALLLGVALAAVAISRFSNLAAPIKVRRSARAFVKSILEQEPELIPESDGMLVMRDVLNLETGVKSDVVIRKLTRPFWQACIDAVDRHPVPANAGRRRVDDVDAPVTTERLRVCAVGTPGIGKTTCTAVLIRMLLKEKRGTVVYHVRAPKEAGWIYEFIPGPDDDGGDPVTANVYPDQAFELGVPSLREASTYYVVDPGDTNDTCNPSPLFCPKVIIVASPDSKHWGANQFTKERAGAFGVLKVFPVWELNEILEARQVLGPDMTAEEAEKRYHQVGGVPRHVFGSTFSFKVALRTQTAKADSLNFEQAERIATINLQALATLDASQPQSALVGFRVANDGTFSKHTIDVIAPRVGDRIFRRFMKLLWDRLLLPSAGNPWIFEAYARYLLGTNRTFTFPRRNGVGMKHPDRRALQFVLLGGCCEIRSARNIVAAAMERSLVVFYPIDPAQKLIDFVYQDSDGHVHAFQVTLAKTHSANLAGILELEQRVGNPGRLSLYYLVPDIIFDRFVTRPIDPRNPGRGTEGARCNIYHVSIPNPNSLEEEP
jgi:hypothetical protein